MRRFPVLVGTLFALCLGGKLHVGEKYTNAPSTISKSRDSGQVSVRNVVTEGGGGWFTFRSFVSFMENSRLTDLNYRIKSNNLIVVTSLRRNFRCKIQSMSGQIINKALDMWYLRDLPLTRYLFNAFTDRGCAKSTITRRRFNKNIHLPK